MKLIIDKIENIGLFLSSFLKKNLGKFHQKTLEFYLCHVLNSACLKKMVIPKIYSEKFILKNLNEPFSLRRGPSQFCAAWACKI